MPFAIMLPDPPVLPVTGNDLFPIRRVYCVGQNYAAHVREMGGNPEREAPFFFTKPADAVTVREHIPYPPATEDLHHEVELVVAIGYGGANIPPDRALNHVFGYGVGIDLTRRDLQAAAKKAGRPWDMAKGFDLSAPCSTIRRVQEVGHLKKGAISLSVNGQTRQKADLSDMIWPVPDIIAHLSRFVTLAPGDLIFTGTPEGVGPITRGERIHAQIEGVGELPLTIS